VLREDALEIQELQVPGLQCAPRGRVHFAMARALACGTQTFDQQPLECEARFAKKASAS
jgi:hypothetical protein